MKQILLINGGTTFNSESDYEKFLKSVVIDKTRLYPKSDWKLTLNKRLGANYEVLVPRMPNTTNAKYKDWKIYFNAVCKVLGEEVILIGHSLGGIFLAKYLSENKFPKKIEALFLISNTLDNISNQTENIFILHSEDDPVVPVSDSDYYMRMLPNSKLVLFQDKGHFNNEEFSGLVYLIKGF